MSKHLDLDDVAHGHPVALRELAELRKAEALAAASKARARELWEALDYHIKQQSAGSLFCAIAARNKHAAHFGKEGGK